MKHFKAEFDRLNFKEALTYILATVTMATGLVMLLLALYIEPRGEIHTSVLTAFGSICIFVGSLLGISLHYDNELEKFKSKAEGMINDMAVNKSINLRKEEKL